MDSEQPPGEQSEQQGMVYPPPPSYYQNMQTPAELPPLPRKPAQPPLAQPHALAGAPPAYNSYGMPRQYQSPPPVKGSRRQMMIIVAIISASVLLLCGAGSWALYNIFGAVSQQVGGATQVVQDFYQHLQKQDYNGAFSDLHIDGLTAGTFTQDAQAVDSQYGTIISFNVSASSVSNTSGWQVTVSVTRHYATYNVPSSLTSINGNWMISAINLNKF